MEYSSRNAVNALLKEHGYGTIESDRPGKNYFSNMPYRTCDGKIVKGIMLFRTSPVTFTDAGRERGKEVVNKLTTNLSKIGEVKQLSDFGFIAKIQVGPTKSLVINGNLDSKEGILYDQTFHYLNISFENVSTKKINLASVERYQDKETEQHELTNDYLNSILSRQ